MRQKRNGEITLIGAYEPSVVPMSLCVRSKTFVSVAIPNNCFISQITKEKYEIR